jgi:hypothetical protein
VGIEICPFCPETRTRSTDHPRLFPKDLLKSAAVPSGLLAYLADFHSRLCAEITLTVRWPDERRAGLIDVASPRSATPVLDRWRSLVPYVLVLDPRAGVLLLSLPPRSVWQITGATAGLVHARGQFPSDHEWAEIMTGHAKAIQERILSCPVVPSVRVAATVGLPTEKMVLSPEDRTIWGDDRHGLRRRIVTTIGGLRESVLSEDDQNRVLKVALGETP